tara:strand:+ start:1033 stop:1251 length:219 start_codon:yes stop_codon:yes gene_type:complete
MSILIKKIIYHLMNHREELEFQLQKVTLAIQEVLEDVYITDKERQKRIKILINFKEAIIYKGRELRIELEAA